MKIFIPTRGRVGRQVTLNSLPLDLHSITYLVCPKDEVKEHKVYCRNVIGQPPSIKTIAQKRAWMLKNCDTDKLVMLDDDVGFYARGPKGLLKEYATDKLLTQTFGWIDSKLDTFPHVGLSSRMGNNHIEKDVITTGRMMHALAYHVPTALKVLKFNRVAFREDMDYTLQLLRAGHDNIIRYDVCVAPGSYGAKGGCSDERTVAASDAEAEKLAALHPGLVKVVQRDYKGVPRKEVIVQWKKALGHG